ncbi:MAG: DNA methyltransferase [Bellilinea sp.]
MMISTIEMNTLYYGDNLEVLRQYIKDESVDLIYLDPPFNSNANYNVLFAEQDGSRAAAQIQAFQDTWQWDQAAAEAFEETVIRGGKVADALRAFQILLGNSNMLAYLAMMAPRLVELHRVLKPTGSLYLHCDPTASHYLKVLLDSIFHTKYFRGEIIWQRTSSHNDSKKWGEVHDTILYYSKTETVTWNPQYTEHDQKYIEAFYRFKDERGIYRLDHIIRSASMGARPNLSYEYKGYKPEWGWRVKLEKLQVLDDEGRISWSSTGRPYLKRYLDEQAGTPIKDIISDIPPIGAQAQERLGYPTQKPQTLLERIIQASSNRGDVVLDPFCGCGTAVAAAQKLGRLWIGIDITHLAIGLIKTRLRDSFGDALQFEVIGEPVSLSGAQALAQDDPFQFQSWALSLVGARLAETKKGADHGIDGRLYFIDDPKAGAKQIILSVKGGHTRVDHVRDLRGVLDREQAQIGVLITLQEPTKPMRAEAASAGFYTSPWGKHARLQILTIEDLLNGGQIDMPPARQTNVTLKKAPHQKTQTGAMQLPLGDED